jgi:hypothetical protein
LIDDLGIYKIIGNTLGWIPSVQDAIGGLQQERFNEKDNRIWKQIEELTKSFDSDPRFPDVFEDTPDFVDTLFGGVSYQEFLIN